MPQQGENACQKTPLISISGSKGNTSPKYSIGKGVGATTPVPQGRHGNMPSLVPNLLGYENNAFDGGLTRVKGKAPAPPTGFANTKDNLKKNSTGETQNGTLPGSMGKGKGGRIICSPQKENAGCNGQCKCQHRIDRQDEMRSPLTSNMTNAEHGVQGGSSASLNQPPSVKMTQQHVQAIYAHGEKLEGLNMGQLGDKLVVAGLLSVPEGDIERINKGVTVGDKRRCLTELIVQKHVINSFEKFLEALTTCDNGAEIAYHINKSYKLLTGQDELPKPEPNPVPKAVFQLGPHELREPENYFEKKVRLEVHSKRILDLGLRIADGKVNPRWDGDNQLYIVQLVKGFPAEQAQCLQVRDTLHKVNGVSVSDWTFDKLDQYLKHKHIDRITIKRQLHDYHCI